jgi:hypothetical protein
VIALVAIKKMTKKAIMWLKLKFFILKLLFLNMGEYVNFRNEKI